MAQKVPPSGLNKGTYLELRVARLLIAQGFSPFVNVYFRSSGEPRSVNSPDIDVMGCYALPDTTLMYAHYDCKSGDSEVVSRILMLNGMRDRIPPGPFVYVRQSASPDLRKYASIYGIQLTDTRQLQEREAGCVIPVFGDEFPSISDRAFHEAWLSSKGTAKNKKLGRILNYFDSAFWSEPPFTRIRRTLAAFQQLPPAFAESGVNPLQQDLLSASILRKLIYSLLVGASHISFVSEANIKNAVADQLVTESLQADELHTIVESTAQFVFKLYGDPAKGPLRQSDYHIPPPEYAEELASLLIRMVHLYACLTEVIPIFDALVVERILQRPRMSETLCSAMPINRAEGAKRWLRSLRLFLSTLRPKSKDWIGWEWVMRSNELTAVIGAPMNIRPDETVASEQQTIPLGDDRVDKQT